MEVDQHKVAMDKERIDKFGVFTVEFAEGSWTSYLMSLLITLQVLMIDVHWKFHLEP